MVNVQTEGALVCMEVDGLTTLEAMQEYLDEMERILSEHESFGLMFLNDMDDEQIRHKNVPKKLAN